MYYVYIYIYIYIYIYVSIALIYYNNNFPMFTSKAMGHTGEVVEVSTQGVVSVRFQSSIFKYNPGVLMKVSPQLASPTTRLLPCCEKAAHTKHLTCSGR